MSARRSTTPSVQLFPFLAVLVCVMGALIFLLLVTTRRIRQQAIERAAAVELQQQFEAGLLTPPPRSAAGYRHYSESTLDELRFIRKGQALGFSLEEIGEILKIGRGGTAPCAHVLELAQRNLEAADERIRHLRLKIVDLLLVSHRRS